ncbi:GNAT family N-acetyltransferase [Paenisporosarcina cavernae]|uniref:N-acetyltransferase n=1 Tax=Paenisporosarcina cavernae TaxID=2320858 RepID=A0A385YUH0_9BACL|nr:GNAT family N-acetyltransferase [Paenisporosarcina cavernae]AYC30509.1 N-acetyltransferase [Paenisporosarcina cavernae]
MEVKYAVYRSITPEDVLSTIYAIYDEIFEDIDLFSEKLKEKKELLLVSAHVGSEVIGFKLGYQLNEEIFYSWLGGVSPAYRQAGIGQELMTIQHENLQELGYSCIQTKTMNKWRSMLILNIKNGFDIVDTYRKDNGEHRIVLEKKL